MGDENKAIRASMWAKKKVHDANSIDNNADDEGPATNENDNGNSIINTNEKPEKAELCGPPRMGPIPQAMDEDRAPSENGSTSEDAEEARDRGFVHTAVAVGTESCAESSTPQETIFTFEETFLIFDWDDTICPSSWVQSQGLRLDESSEVSPDQRTLLAEVAKTSAQILQTAKRYGKVILITNAERGWIELSCMKFMPTLFPVLEGIKIVSARTAYDTPRSTPLDWKLLAFDAEIRRTYGEGLHQPERRKNVLSLGDSFHEREALLRATASINNCRSKSLKFVERPDLNQICKQHNLVTGCFERIIYHDANLDLCIRCA